MTILRMLAATIHVVRSFATRVRPNFILMLSGQAVQYTVGFSSYVHRDIPEPDNGNCQVQTGARPLHTP